MSEAILNEILHTHFIPDLTNLVKGYLDLLSLQKEYIDDLTCKYWGDVKKELIKGDKYEDDYNYVDQCVDYLNYIYAKQFVCSALYEDYIQFYTNITDGDEYDDLDSISNTLSEIFDGKEFEVSTSLECNKWRGEIDVYTSDGGRVYEKKVYATFTYNVDSDSD